MLVEGKVALVTGGAQGMGRAFAELLLKHGAKVCIADVNTEAGEATLSEFHSKYGADKAVFCKCNVTLKQDYEDTFQTTKETFGGLDIVINNAGIGGETEEMWERVVDVNMKGVLRGTRLALFHMNQKNGGTGGVIINVASAAGINPNPLSPVYACTKAGVIHLTRSCALLPNIKESNIRLSIFCPAFVDTPMLANIKKAAPEHEERVAAFVAKIGVISVEEAAEALLKLLEDDSANGAIMRVDKAKGMQYCTISIDYSPITAE